VEIEPAYVTMSKERIERELTTLFRPATPANHLSHEAAPLPGPFAIGDACDLDPRLPMAPAGQCDLGIEIGCTDQAGAANWVVQR
jgi:hypothetical protein